MASMAVFLNISKPPTMPRNANTSMATTTRTSITETRYSMATSPVGTAMMFRQKAGGSQ